MTVVWPSAGGSPEVTAILRQSPADFQVFEQLGFELSGEGEHVFLHLQKQQLNSTELLQKISSLSGIHPRDIGMSGLKDRNAITRQWFSVRMAGKAEPDWKQLEQAGNVSLLEVGRHRRKLKRGVHRANRFVLRLRNLHGDTEDLVDRLERVKVQGVPNYFGEQRFGRDGSTLLQAGDWLRAGSRKITRTKRSLYLSALRAYLFNTLLGNRVVSHSWNRVLNGDMCILQGTRSQFSCDNADEEISERALRGDLHPGLPLWGRGGAAGSAAGSTEQFAAQATELASCSLVGRGGQSIGGDEICQFLERMGLELDYRAARILPDDFCWQFCDDNALQLEFALAPGSYATAVLAELLKYTDIKRNRGKSGSSE